MSQLNDLLNRLINRSNPTEKKLSISRPSEHLLTHEGMDLYASFEDILPDPDLVLKKAGLTSSVYYDLMTDPHVSGCVQQRKSRTKRMDMIFVSGKANDAKADQALEFFQEQIEGIGRIPEVVNEILDAPLYGAQYLEMFWNVIPISSANPNGRINLTNLMAKPFEWFAYDINNELKIKSQDSTFAELRDIPPNKILSVVKDGTYKNPYGARAFKACFWAFMFKKGGIRFWTEFLEKYGSPFLYGKLDSKKSQSDLDDFFNSLVNMVRNGVAVTSSDGGDEQIEVVEAGGKGDSSEAYSKYKNAMNIEISKGILGETLTIENSESGSQNATDTHAEILAMLQDEDAETVERTFNRLARLVTDLNFGVDVPSPKTVMSDPKDLSTSKVERDTKLSKDLSVKFKKAYIAKTYKLDDEDFDIVVPTVNTPEDTTGKKDNNFSDYRQMPIQDDVDLLVDTSIRRMEFLTEDLQAKVIKIFKDANNFNDAVYNLSMLRDSIDSDIFAKMFGETLDLAYAIGQYAVNEDKI